MANLTNTQKQLLTALVTVGANSTVPSAVANKGRYYEIVRKGLLGRGNVVDTRFANVLRQHGTGFAREDAGSTVSTVLNSLAKHGVLRKPERGVYHLRIDTAEQVCFV